MTTKYPTLFFAGLLLCLTACKKNDNIINAQLVGKWNVNKIVIHIVSSASSLGAVHDTTYSGSAFNASDYMQFNSNYTASLSTSGDFSYSGKATFTDGAGNPGIGGNTYIYSVSGNLITLKSTLLVPGANNFVDEPLIDTIVALDANTLILKNSMSYTDITLTTETYYTRAN